MGRVVRLLVGLALVLAACGGGTEEPGAVVTTAAGDGGGTTATTSGAAVTTTTTAAPVANPSDDFCEFIVAYAAETDLSPVGLNPDEIEAMFTNNLAALNQAVALAPAEIRGDVESFVEAYGGFIELLAENDFNFLAMAGVDQNDPRLTALDNPELSAAGDRIEAYCGIDSFIATAPTSPGTSGGSSGGTGGGITTNGELPEDFPTELIPDGATIAWVLDIEGVDTVTYDIELAADDVIAFYEELLGPAAAELSDPKGALWITTYEGVDATIAVSATDASTTQVNISLA